MILLTEDRLMVIHGRVNLRNQREREDMKSLKTYFHRAAARLGLIDPDDSLRMAAWNGDNDTVSLLLADGVDVHARNNEALRLADMHGHSETMEVLLEAGADVHARDDAALRWVEMYGHEETAKALKEWIARERRPADPERGRGSAAGPEIHPY